MIGNKSFLIAFPVVRTPGEFRFLSRLSDLITRSGFTLEVIAAENQGKKQLALLKAFGPKNIVLYSDGMPEDEIGRRLIATPERALVHNDLVDERRALVSLLRARGTEVRIWERSPLATHQWIEDDIFFGGSKLNHEWTTSDVSSNYSSRAERLVAEMGDSPDGARNFEYSSNLRIKTTKSSELPPRDFLLFLLDNTKVTRWGEPNLIQPMASLYPLVSNPSDALNIFSAVASARGLDFLVKTHPSDPAPKGIAHLDSFELSDLPSSVLMSNSVGVVSGISKSLWSAAAKGQPFASLGLNPVGARPSGVKTICTLDDLVKSFIRDFDRGSSIELSDLVRLVGFADENVWVENDFGNPAALEFQEWVTGGSSPVEGGEPQPNLEIEFTKEERIVANESNAALSLVAFTSDLNHGRDSSDHLVFFDVGANIGEVTRFARELDYEVHSFEPNPEVAKRFIDQHREDRDVFFSRLALSNGSERVGAFYTSAISSGISSLVPFHDSHVHATNVFTTSLATYLRYRHVTHIDVLKTDAEGFDLFVLEGHDWSEPSLVPNAIVCEFENAKTVALGYTADDVAQFLMDKGYTVFVSEWFPIEAYGSGRHCWRSFYLYGDKIIPEDAWGNFIAIRNIRSDDLFVQFTNELRQRTSPASEGSTNSINQRTTISDDGPKRYRSLRTKLLAKLLRIDRVMHRLGKRLLSN